MHTFRIAAIPSALAEEVRQTRRAPAYGFPVHEELSTDAAPCRHCLRTFQPGVDRRILFTYDRFSGIESFPQPGPVYIHEETCERYPEDGGFPEELRSSPRTLEAYGRGRRFLAQEIISDGRFESAIARLFAIPEADYVLVSSTTAGCFTLRIDRAKD